MSATSVYALRSRITLGTTRAGTLNSMVYSMLELQSAKYYLFEVIRSLSRDGPDV